MDNPFAAYKGDGRFVFASYSHADNATVFPELARLHDQGVNIWYDEGIEAGSEWRQSIGQAILNASAMLYFVSQRSIASENCRKEVAFADKQKIPIIAVHLESTELPASLDLTLSDRQGILKYDLPQQEYQDKLAARTSFYLDQPLIAPSPAAAPRRSRLKLASLVIISLALVGTLVMSIDTSRGWLTEHGTSPALDVVSAVSSEQLEIAAGPPLSDASSAQLSREELARSRYSIAVLPFSVPSNDDETGNFARGLSDAILDNLVQGGNISVASRSASAQALASGGTLQSIAEQLKAAYLLEGRVGRLGDNLRISVQLTRASDGFLVWSKNYDRDYAEGYTMTPAVARNISYVAAGRLNFDILSTHGAREDPQFQGVEPEAMKHYMDAGFEFLLIRSGEGGSPELWERYVRMALELDPDFQAALLLLVHLYITRREATMSYAQAAPLAHAAIAKLREINPDYPDLPSQAGQVYLMFDLDYERAQSLFNQCLQAYPRHAVCHYSLGVIDQREGRVTEALSKFTAAARSATEMPFQKNILLTVLAWQLLLIGDYEASIEASARARGAAVDGPALCGTIQIQSLALLLRGEIEQARTFIAEAWQVDNRAHPEMFVLLYALAGDDEKARQILGDKRHKLDDSTALAAGYLALGEIDRSFEFIKAGIENREVFMADALRGSAIFDEIKPDPRYQEMVALLDSTETHTDQYLATHGVIDQQVAKPQRK